MAYLVRIAARAERDFASLFEEIRAESSETARRWFLGLKRAVLSLERMPNLCSATPRSALLRHLLYGRHRQVYRAIFRVLEEEKVVEVLHIRHGSRQAFVPSDLDDRGIERKEGL
jgi:plasmid stabilization system protein ParE